MKYLTKAIAMKRVLSTGNKSTERRFRLAMSRAGLRGWKVRPKMKLSPNFVFEKEKVAIFIDGGNLERGKKAVEKLSQEGWSVLSFSEHQVEKKIDACLSILKEILSTNKNRSRN